MAYTGRDWDNTGTKVTKEDFKRMETGIKNNDNQINVLNSMFEEIPITLQNGWEIESGTYKAIRVNKMIFPCFTLKSGSGGGATMFSLPYTLVGMTTIISAQDSNWAITQANLLLDGYDVKYWGSANSRVVIPPLVLV